MLRSATKSRADKSRAVPAPPTPSVQLVIPVDIVPGRLTETDWLEMVAREEGEEVVADVIGELLEGVLDRCHDVYLQKQQVPFTVWWARETLVRTVEWRFVVRDEGEDPDSAILWTEDPEPQASIRDCWAEGCVPVVYAFKNEHTPLLQKLLDLNLEESKESTNPDAHSKCPSQCDERTPPSSLQDMTPSLQATPFSKQAPPSHLQAPPSILHPPAKPGLQSAKLKYTSNRNKGNSSKPQD